jgi:2'-5' RNA ligase
MAFAVSLLFDPETAAAISARWDLLAATGVSRSMLDLGYKPHVTLAVYDELIVDRMIAALDGVFEHVDQLAVTLTDVTTFGSGSGVCYAALAPSPELMRLHATILGAIGEGCRPHYKAGSWTPHCTLATDIPDADMGNVKAILDRDWRPLVGQFETAELVEFAPVVGIRSWVLAAPPRSIRTL